MSSAGSRGSEDGATLLEVLVVLTITVMISALAYPNLAAGLERSALRLQSRTLAADLATARADAIRSGRPVAFSISPDGRAYAWNGGALHHLRQDGAVLRAPQGGPLFLPDGTAAPAELRLETRRAVTVLVIDATTGSVRSGAS